MGYKFYLLVLKVYFQHSKIKFVSPCGHVISFLSLSNCTDNMYSTGHTNWRITRALSARNMTDLHEGNMQNTCTRV